MFRKKNDLFLKITNSILIIIAVVSLGIAIGSNYYDQNESGFNCGSFKNSTIINNSISTKYTNGDDAENDYTASCKYASIIDDHQNKREMIICYSLFGSAIVGLFICNLCKKKEN